MNSVLVVCSLALCMCIFSANALNMKEQLDFVSNYFNNLDQLGKSFRELAINSPPCLESVDILTEPLDVSAAVYFQSVHSYKSLISIYLLHCSFLSK